MSPAVSTAICARVLTGIANVTTYRRYESRSYWKDVHEQSQAYKDFVQRVKDAKLEIQQSVSVLYETDIGHM